jgi:hypothetical protein
MVNISGKKKLTWVGIVDIQGIVDTGDTIAANLIEVERLCVADTLEVRVPVASPVSGQKAGVQRSSRRTLGIALLPSTETAKGKST